MTRINVAIGGKVGIANGVIGQQIEFNKIEVTEEAQ
jgi:hypothetical protein